MKLDPTSILRRVKKVIQSLLDRFYYSREWIGVTIAFLAIRFTAVEVSWAQIKSKQYTPHTPALSPDSQIEHPEGMLEAAKEVLKAAGSRRDAIVDKGKTLITLSGLFLALLGFLLPKEFGVPEGTARVAMLVSIGLFTVCLVLLLSFFDIGADATPGLCVPGLEKDEQERALALEYCTVASRLEGRSDYLVDVYGAARFYFYAAFLTAIAVIVINFSAAASANQADRVIRALRSDPKLLGLLKGPQGDQGAVGPRGATGQTRQMTAKETAEIVVAVRRALESSKDKAHSTNRN